MVLLAAFCLRPMVSFADPEGTPARSAPIPMDQIGTVAGQQYQGDGLSVTATPEGARLRCAFQKLEGQATREGLWLTSTAEGANRERFRVVATAVGRSAGISAGVDREDSRTPPTKMSALLPATGQVQVTGQTVHFLRPGVTEEYTVSVDGVRQDFVITERPTSMLVRTDSTPSQSSARTRVEPRPPISGAAGMLRLDLAVTGATADPLANGARLTLAGSVRQLAYNRLRVTDATGQELPARMEVIGKDGFHSVPNSSAPNSDRDAVERVPTSASGVAAARQSAAGLSNGAPVCDRLCAFHDRNALAETTAQSRLQVGAPKLAAALSNAAVQDTEDGSALPSRRYDAHLAVLVDDAGAVYPLRIDPTFSDANWISMGSIPGANGTVNAAVVDGAGNLYIGGTFTAAGGVMANCIAKWNGSAWSALGSGMNSNVNGLAVSGTNLFAGGNFTMAGGVAATRIAKWNGSAWSALGSGMNGSVNALAISGLDLYAGGDFGVAKWNGTAWSALGSGVNDSVLALAVSGTNLYVGGYFTIAGAAAANSIAKWNGSGWSSLGLEENLGVQALAVTGTDVYAAVVESYDLTSGVVKWNGSEWSVCGWFDNIVHAVSVSGTDVYVGGEFQSVDGWLAISYVAKWNGSDWAELDSGMGYGDYVYALAASGTDLYAGGAFSVAKWDGSAWSGLGAGIGLGGGYYGTFVSALAVSGSDLYAGGDFSMAGGIVVYSIAKWNGSSWTALGSGLNSTVDALAVSGTNLYAGGSFTRAGGGVPNYIAKWNGSAWSALGSGVNNSITALAISGRNLYAGGWFTMAGGSAANYVAKWDGSAWSALGSGMNNPVKALAASGTDLYAGGVFTNAGGIAANCIAKWDGNVWCPLGAGLGGGQYPSVNALAMSGTNLYAAGASGVSKWNGTAWSAVGWMGYQTYYAGNVYALAVSGTNLYAGGRFDSVPGNAANYIAKWNGSAWSALGAGMDSTVWALAISGTDLYVGGTFTTAGGKGSPYLAKALLNGPPINLTGASRFSNGAFLFAFMSNPGGSLNALAATNAALPASNWTTLGPVTETAPGQYQFTDPQATNLPRRFYRVLAP